MHERAVTQENGPKRTFASMSREWAALVIISIGPLFFLVAHFSDEGRAIAASLSAATVAVIVRYFWDLRKRIWFWITVAIIAFLHILLVVFLPLPDKQWNYLHWNYVQMLPFGLLDFAIAYGIIRLAEKVVDRSS